ncbi:MAG: FG-GAP repeat domain-containing protein, partial [Gammaproteobacteria bacterium]
KVRAGMGARSVVSADLNGDGLSDLVTANSDAGTVSILRRNKDGSLTPLPQLPAGKTPRSVTAADVNGDGRPDLVVANMDSETFTLLLNTGPKPQQ